MLYFKDIGAIYAPTYFYSIVIGNFIKKRIFAQTRMMRFKE